MQHGRERCSTLRRRGAETQPKRQEIAFWHANCFVRCAGEETDEPALKVFRRGWCHGSGQFQKQMIERMDGKLGEHHSGELRRENAQSKAKRVMNSFELNAVQGLTCSGISVKKLFPKASAFERQKKMAALALAVVGSIVLVVIVALVMLAISLWHTPIP